MILQEYTNYKIEGLRENSEGFLSFIYGLMEYEGVRAEGGIQRHFI